MSKTVVIAGCEAPFKEELSSILDKAGHRVVLQKESSEVVDLLTLSPSGADFLLLEITLPPCGPFKTLKTARSMKRSAGLPVFVRGSDAEIGPRIGALKDYGVTGYFSDTLSAERTAYQINQHLFMAKKRRSKPRISVSIDAVMTMGQNCARGRVLNLSAGGLFLFTPVELKPGSAVKVRFSLPAIHGDENHLGLIGTVLDRNRLTEVNSGWFGTGVKISGITERDRTELLNFLDASFNTIYLKKIT